MSLRIGPLPTAEVQADLQILWKKRTEKVQRENKPSKAGERAKVLGEMYDIAV
jgi:hypothetical protein